jgi:hypothetical protein
MINYHIRIVKDNKYYEYDNINDVPLLFDNLIEFRPIIPMPPHTEEEHLELENIDKVFLRLLERETGCQLQQE